VVDVGEGVADVDCARAIGEKRQRMAMANTRRFIAVANLFRMARNRNNYLH
jgi:hypothetical protein